MCDCKGTGESPVSTDCAGFASKSSRLVFTGAGILIVSTAPFSISLRCVSVLKALVVPEDVGGSILAGVSFGVNLPSMLLSTPKPTLERASPSVGPGPGNVLSLVTRFDAEEEGLIRPLFDCAAFCGAREDCGRLVAVDPGLVAFRGALNVPMTGDGANTGDSIAELPVLFLLANT